MIGDNEESAPSRGPRANNAAPARPRRRSRRSDLHRRSSSQAGNGGRSIPPRDHARWAPRTPRRRRCRLAALLPFILALAGRVPSIWAEPLIVEAEPLQVSRQQIAKHVQFFGALQLRARDPRFGGLSGLCIDATGARLTAVSDRGTWVSLALRADSSGRLAGVGPGEIGRLIGEDGKPLLYRDTDAEALACLPDGSHIVAFERNHRLLRYPPAAMPFSKAPVRLPPPPGLTQLPVNFGVEALAHLGGDVLVAISEMPVGGQSHHLAWTWRNRTWSPFAYVPQIGFRVTDAVATPTGDLLVLEHHYNPLLGTVVRLAHVAPQSLAASQRVAGQHVLTLTRPDFNANFEGLSVREGPMGERYVYVISDNNFQAHQPTLLLMLKLERGAIKTSP